MSQVAEKLDMDFYPEDNSGMIDYLEGFRIFSQGRRKSVKNLLIKVDPETGLDTRIFDYRFVIGGGNSTRAIKQTIFYLHSKEISLPNFLMKPEHFFHKIGDFLGAKGDIDFEEFPDFSKQYYLEGDDELDVRSTFSNDMLHFFTIEKKLVTGRIAKYTYLLQKRQTTKPGNYQRLF